jgi:hypothetical protein
MGATSLNDAGVQAAKANRDAGKREQRESVW